MLKTNHLIFVAVTLLTCAGTILPGCAGPDTLRYIVRGDGMSEITINQIPMEDLIEPGGSFQSLTRLGVITDSSFVQNEYSSSWHLSLPGVRLEYLDAGDPVLQRMIILDPAVPVTLNGENIFDWRMNESTLARLGAVENRDDRMTIQEKFGGAPEYWEFFVDPESGKVIKAVIKLGMH